MNILKEYSSDENSESLSSKKSTFALITKGESKTASPMPKNLDQNSETN